MHKQHNQKVITTKKNSGFTLIELLVVISIIGILSSVILASLSGARRSADNAVSIAETRQFQTQLALYFLENGGYPVLPWVIPGYSFWACIGLNCSNSTAFNELRNSTINNPGPYGGSGILSLKEQTTTSPKSFSALFGPARAEAAGVGFSQFNLVKRTYPIIYYCSRTTTINNKILCPDGNAWVVNPSFSGNTVTYGAVQAGGSQIGTITGYGY